MLILNQEEVTAIFSQKKKERESCCPLLQLREDPEVMLDRVIEFIGQDPKLKRTKREVSFINNVLSIS